MRSIFERLDKIEDQGETIMAAIDDLNAAVAALGTEATAVEKAVTDLVAAVTAGGAPTPAVEAAVANLNAVTAALKTSAASDPTP